METLCKKVWICKRHLSSRRVLCSQWPIHCQCPSIEPFTFSCQYNTTITKSLSSFQCGRTVTTLFMPPWLSSFQHDHHSINKKWVSKAFVSRFCVPNREHVRRRVEDTSLFATSCLHCRFIVSRPWWEEGPCDWLIHTSAIRDFFDAPLTSRVDNSPQIAAYNQHDISQQLATVHDDAIQTKPLLHCYPGSGCFRTVRQRVCASPCASTQSIWQTIDSQWACSQEE